MKCQCCEIENVRYKLALDNQIKCPHCQYIKYNKKDLRLNLCSTQCKSLYWSPVEYLTPKGSKDVKVIYCLEKDECNNCGLRDFPGALFVGKYLDATKKSYN